MEINISKEKRLVEIWLTNQDKKDEKTSELVRKTVDKYSGENFRVAVFMSGNRSLFDCTEGLIQHNRGL